MHMTTFTTTPAAQRGATPSTRNQAALGRAALAYCTAAEAAEAGRRLLEAPGPPAKAI
ncbi:MAG TPA: hypothetical protein VKJ01_10745 [Candidatus Solibacter sp.]|nr:hypothetical protein [Candidatus Solibacter sp.]